MPRGAGHASMGDSLEKPAGPAVSVQGWWGRAPPCFFMPAWGHAGLGNSRCIPKPNSLASPHPALGPHGQGWRSATVSPSWAGYAPLAVRVASCGTPAARGRSFAAWALRLGIALAVRAAGGTAREPRASRIRQAADDTERS